MLLLPLGAAAQEKPPAVGSRTAPPTECTTNCLALPDAPEPAPDPNSLVGPVASAPYVALTPHQKLGIFLHHTYSPYTFVSTGLNATWSQIVGDFPGYGGGLPGYGKRYGAALAGTEARSFFGSFLLPVITHEDPRFFPRRKGSILRRFWYAGTRVLVTRRDDGSNTVNWSELLGTAITMSLCNAYFPDADRGAWKTFSRSYGAIGGDAGSLVLKEFMPDIKRFWNRHAPRPLKRKVDKIEQKLPDVIVPK